MISVIFYWISGFWLLKLVPIPFASFIFISVIISSLVVLFRTVQGKFEVFPRPSWSDVGVLFLAVFLLLMFTPLSVRLIAPPGQDMSVHGYAARLIQEKNTFPKSYQLIVPIRRFGSTPFGFSVLSAAFSLLENVPVYRSILFFTWLTYIVFGIALFLFLNMYFPVIVSVLTSLTTLFLSTNIIGHIDWGELDYLIACVPVDRHCLLSPLA